MASLSMFLRLAVAVAATFALAGAARAATATFDFEGTPVTADSAGITSLTLTQNGLTATFTRGGSGFGIEDLSGLSGPASFGQRTLSPFFGGGTGGFLVTFSQAVTALSVVMGDYFGDTDTMSATAFAGADGSGAVVGSASANFPNTLSFPNDMVTLNLSGSFRSVFFIGGSTNFPNSVYYDNVVVTFDPPPPAPPVGVPAPAGIAILGAGLLGLGALRRIRPAG